MAGSDFAGRVPFETEQRVIPVHANTVIDDTNHGGPAARDRHFDPACTCVNAVFDEFFHHGRRSLNHFSGSNLAGDFFR